MGLFDKISKMFIDDNEEVKFNDNDISDLSSSNTSYYNDDSREKISTQEKNDNSDEINDSHNDVCQFEYLKYIDDANWFLTPEAEYEFENKLDTLHRTDFIIKYLSASYKDIDFTDYYIIALIIADGMYNSGIQNFTNLKGLLSEETNPIIELMVDGKQELKQISTNKVINRMLCAIHNINDEEFTFDELTQLNSSSCQSSLGIYTLEREIIWFLSEKDNIKSGFGPYDFFGIKDKIGKKNVLDEEFDKAKTTIFINQFYGYDITEEERKEVEDMLSRADIEYGDDKYYMFQNRERNIDFDSLSLYDDAVEFVIAQRKANTSLLQRKFGIGYNRAARLIDQMEDNGIIGPANGSKPREIYAVAPSYEAVIYTKEDIDQQAKNATSTHI